MKSKVSIGHHRIKRGNGNGQKLQNTKLSNLIGKDISRTDKGVEMYSVRGLYSQLEKVVTEKLEMPAKIQSIPKWLERQGVKPAEMKWMGVGAMAERKIRKTAGLTNRRLLIS